MIEEMLIMGKGDGIKCLDRNFSFLEIKFILVYVNI